MAKKDHSFDLNKRKSNRKFDLSKDSDQEPVAINPPVIEEPEDFKNSGRSKKWYYICGAAVIVGLVIWYLCDRRWNDESQNQPQIAIAQVENPNSSDAIAAQEGEEYSENQDNPSTLDGASEERTQDASVMDSPEQLQAQSSMVNSQNDGTETSITNEEVPATSVITSTQASVPAKSSIGTESQQHSSSTSVQSLNGDFDLETEAKNVIAGKYGNGMQRRNALGDNYKKIQKLVNKKKRQGLF